MMNQFVVLVSCRLQILNHCVFVAGFCPPLSSISQWSQSKGQRAPVSGAICSCKQNVRKPHVVLPTIHARTKKPHIAAT